MQLDWLTSHVPEGDDIVTVALDATRDSEHGYQAVLTRWRDIRRSLEGRGVATRTLDHVDEQIRVPTHVAGKHGRVLVVGPEGVVIDRVLAQPPVADAGTLGVDPFALAAVADDTVAYLLAEIDRTGADLTLQQHALMEYEAGDELDSVEGEHDVINKVRRAGMASRRLQSRAEDSWERNAETVAGELSRIVSERHPELLLLTGDVRAVSLVRERLSSEAAAIATVLDGGSRSAGVNEQAFDRKLGEALDIFRARRREEVLDRFRQEEGREGTATQSMDDVVTALARGQVEELIGRFQDGRGTGFEQFGDGAEPPAHTDGVHPGMARGEDVDIGVSDEITIRRGGSENLRRFEGPGGVGLALDPVAGTEDHLPRPVGEKGLDTFQGEVVGLVREHAEGHAGGGECVEQRGDAGEGRGGVLPVMGVGLAILQDHLFRLLSLGGAESGRENVADEIEHAVPDEGAVVVGRVQGESPRREQGVPRVGEILQGVEERSVEVENDGFFVGGGHGVGCCRFHAETRARSPAISMEGSTPHPQRRAPLSMS